MDKTLLYQGLLSVLITGLYLVSAFFVGRIIRSRSLVFNLDSDRRVFVSRFLRLVLAGVAFTFLGVIWNISFSGLGVYFASFFAVAGVALFAHWSILSNITASVILYFYYPYQIGSRVKIIDGENSVMGVVKDLNLFAIKIETNDGEVSYPNNLAVQKPIIQLLS